MIFVTNEGNGVTHALIFVHFHMDLGDERAGGVDHFGGAQLEMLHARWLAFDGAAYRWKAVQRSPTQLCRFNICRRAHTNPARLFFPGSNGLNYDFDARQCAFDFTLLEPKINETSVLATDAGRADNEAWVQLRASHAPKAGAELRLPGSASARVIARDDRFYRLEFEGTGPLAAGVLNAHFMSMGFPPHK
jgi:hypothetical protein